MASTLEPYKATLIGIFVKWLMGLLLLKAPWLSYLKWVLEPLLGVYVRRGVNKFFEKLNEGLIEIAADHDVEKLERLLKEIDEVPEDEAEKRDALEKEIVSSARDLIRFRPKQL